MELKRIPGIVRISTLKINSIPTYSFCTGLKSQKRSAAQGFTIVADSNGTTHMMVAVLGKAIKDDSGNVIKENNTYIYILSRNKDNAGEIEAIVNDYYFKHANSIAYGNKTIYIPINDKSENGGIRIACINNEYITAAIDEYKNNGNKRKLRKELV